MAPLSPVTPHDVATRAGLEATFELLRQELRADMAEAANRQMRWLTVFAAVWSTVLLILVGLIS